MYLRGQERPSPTNTQSTRDQVHIIRAELRLIQVWDHRFPLGVSYGYDDSLGWVARQIRWRELISRFQELVTMN
jgi:hypothetical protein